MDPLLYFLNRECENKGGLRLAQASAAIAKQKHFYLLVHIRIVMLMRLKKLSSYDLKKPFCKRFCSEINR